MGKKVTQKKRRKSPKKLAKESITTKKSKHSKSETQYTGTINNDL